MSEQPTQEIDPKEVVCAYLERERTIWMTAPSGSERMRAYDKINNLLDELSSLALRQTVETPDVAS